MLTESKLVGLPGEDPARFQHHSESTYRELNPQTALQEVMVQQIIHVSWRLSRLNEAEAALFASYNARRREQLQAEYQDRLQVHKTHPHAPKPTPPNLSDLSAADILGRLFEEEADRSNPILRLHRYQASLNSTLIRYLKELRTLQRQQQRLERQEQRQQRQGTKPTETERQEQIEARQEVQKEPTAEMQNEAKLNSAVPPPVPTLTATSITARDSDVRADVASPPAVQTSAGK